MLSRIRSFGVSGIGGFEVAVEVYISGGLSSGCPTRPSRRRASASARRSRTTAFASRRAA